jgi:Protein of unknown function (DUF2723)
VTKEPGVGSREPERTVPQVSDARRPEPDTRVASIVFIAAFALYLKTLAPAVGPTDSGELTTAAWSLGNAHPPGFPFFLILTHLFTWLPVGTIAVRTNVATAFFAAVACALVSLAAAEILLMPREMRAAKLPAEEKRSKKKQRGRTGESDLRIQTGEPALRAPSRWVVALIMLACGLLFAFSRTLWDFATVTEVYAVNSALMAAVAWGMLRWARTRDVRWLYAAALLFGLGLCVHHVTIGTGAFAIAVLITRVGGIQFWRSRTTLIAALLLAAGLLVYAYLPIAASRKPVMNWGDPASVSAVWDHVTGKQYRSYIKTTGEQNSAQFDRYFGIVGRELGPPWLPLVLLIAAAGIVLLFIRLRTIFWYVVLFILGNVAWFAIYPITNDTEAYAIPTFIALLFAFAFGASSIAELGKTERMRYIVAGAMLILPLISLVTTYPFRDRSHYWVSKDYADNGLRSMRLHSLLLTSDWQLYAPMRYRLDVEHTRPDVEVIETGFLLRPWYFGDLSRRYPTLTGDSRREIDALLPMLEPFQNDRNQVDMELFNRRIDDLIVSLIEQHLRRGPVYLSTETAASTDPRDVNLRKRINERWDIVPRGLLIELVPGHAFRDVHYTQLQTRGVADGSIQYDEDDVVPVEIRPAYLRIYLMTGRYLAILKKYPEALLAYRAAVQMDPQNSSVEREMQLVESRIN